MKKQMIEYLTNRREFLEDELSEAKRLLERAQRQVEKVEAALMQNEIEIDEFKRECLTSPRIDVIITDSRIRTLLKKAGITTVYELRHVLRHDKYIQGVGELNKSRLRAFLNQYDAIRQASA